MAKRFVKMVTGELFVGDLPTSVTLPESLQDGEIFVTNLVTYNAGEKGWNDALFRFMFLNGYCYPEDNDREMKNPPPHPKS